MMQNFSTDSFRQVIKKIKSNPTMNLESGANYISPEAGRVTTNHRNYRLSDCEIEALIGDNELINRINTVIPKQANKVKPAFPDLNKAALKKLTKQLDTLNVSASFTDAGILGNTYGTCYLYLNIDDGLDDTMPVDFNKKNAIINMTLLTSDHCQPSSSLAHYHHTPPSIFTLNLGEGNTIDVHESRLILFYGKKRYGRKLWETRNQHEPNWLGSYNALLNYLEAQSAALAMLKDASVGVFKFEGLRDLLTIAQGCAEDDAKITDAIYGRLSSLVDGVNIMKKLIIDKDLEDYQFIERDYSSVTQIVSDFRSAFLGVSPLPASIMFNNSENAGLFSSGNSGDRQLLDHLVQEYSLDQLQPAYNKLLLILGFESNIEFASTIQLSTTEQNQALFDLSKSLTSLVSLGIMSASDASKTLAKSPFLSNTHLANITYKESEMSQQTNLNSSGLTSEQLNH